MATKTRRQATTYCISGDPQPLEEFVNVFAHWLGHKHSERVLHNHKLAGELAHHESPKSGHVKDALTLGGRKVDVLQPDDETGVEDAHDVTEFDLGADIEHSRQIGEGHDLPQPIA